MTDDNRRMPDATGAVPRHGGAKWFALLAISAAVFVLVSSRWLPDPMASHFDAAGQSNGSMPRSFYIGLMLFLTVILPTLLVYVPVLAFRIPGARIHLPYRAYWLAPERREETIAYIHRQSLRLSAVLIVFLCYVQVLVIKANTQLPPVLPTATLLGGLALFMLFVAAWAIMLVLHFQRPQ